MEAKARREMNVAVLAGGISDERDISFASGANAVQALKEAGYEHVELVDPGAEGFLSKLSEGNYDVAFIALHGKGGEDGMIQDILEFLHIPYTGSDSISSACAVDKDLAKLLYARAGIPIAPGIALVPSREAWDVDAIASVVGEECFVKPAVNGSSYGISLVKRREDLPAAIEHAFNFGGKVLIEQRIRGIEVTVGVYGADDNLQALPVVEICKPEQAEFYDLDIKYIDPTDIHRIPARLPEDQYRLVQELACKAHRSLGCFGFSRSDFIVSEEGPVILETNTIPGMTPTSLFPDEVRHAGLEFSQVCAGLIDMALERAAQ